jgi:hypothetical protein
MWAGHVVFIGEKRNYYKIVGGKLMGKKPLGRVRRRWAYGLSIVMGVISLNIVHCPDQKAIRPFISETGFDFVPA